MAPAPSATPTVSNAEPAEHLSGRSVMDESTTAAAAGTIDVGGDLTVQRLGFGAMRITGPGIWGEPPDRAAAKAVLRRAVELGVDFIDTADSYGPDVSEELIAEALHPYPENLVVATKGGLERTGPGRWPSNAHPDHLVEACEGSLRRLRLEQIPLYQLHRPDPRVPYEDSVGALVELKEQGKIRHIGVSNVSEDQLRTAQKLTPVVSVQNRYNLTDRSSESIVDLCEQEGLAFLPWAPIQDGDVPLVGEIAARHGATPHRVVLAWLLARSSAMLPIPGTGSVAHLEENVAAAGLELAPDEVASLNAAGG
jgi:pyridoxine 4-dehydrogenase